MKRRDFGRPSGLLLLACAGMLAFLPAVASVANQEQPPPLRLRSIQAVDPGQQGDGTMSPAARRALTRGPLPASAAETAAKAAADRAYDEAARAGRLPVKPGEPAAGDMTPRTPVIVGARSFAGIFSTSNTPPDTTGAIGPTRYIQLVNTRFGIYNRTSNTPLSTGTLNSLAGISSTVFTTDPQVIWDPTTQRFYYVILSIFSATQNVQLFGFSKTASPSSAADWCKYSINYGSNLPDFPKLGDSQHFIIIGSNVFDANENFIGADVAAVGKPPAGNITTCPLPSALVFGEQFGLKDANGVTVFTPVPANQVDTSGTSYIVARNVALPSTKLWIFSVTRSATGAPVIQATGKGLTVSSYTFPASARQPVLSQLLDTSDARPTNAVLAKNPRRSNAFSLWTQHTIANGNFSQVRWYEINPAGTTPALRTSGIIAPAGTFAFNAAISPDRRVDGTTVAFGGSFVVGYNVSSATNNINPQIVMGSSVSGGALSFALVKNGVGPYRDFSCPAPGDVCRWGDYSGATPDPKPATTSNGVVWLTNQFSGVANPSTTQANWRTWIWAARP